jgi:hypothetical protein
LYESQINLNKDFSNVLFYLPNNKNRIIETIPKLQNELRPQVSNTSNSSDKYVDIGKDYGKSPYKAPHGCGFYSLESILGN